MARYVGARYVPVFAGAWDNTQEYEALTVVTYQGDSYTSKMYVPTGVDILNTIYWIKSGDFNQQVAALQTTVNNMAGDVADLQDDVADIPNTISDMFTVDTYREQTGVFQSGVSQVQITFNKPGWRAIAIKGFSVGGTYSVDSLLLSDTEAAAIIRTHSETAQLTTLRLEVLFIRDSSIQ